MLNQRTTLIAYRFLAIFFLSLGACSKPFLVDNFENEYKPKTKTLAIIPFANLTKQSEGAKAGHAIREAVYYQLSKEPEKYTVAIQDIAESYRLLHEAHIAESTSIDTPDPELCRILGVDALMRGAVTKYEKGSPGSFTASIIRGRGSLVKVQVCIYDCANGSLVWQYVVTERGGDVFGYPDELRDRVGRVIADEFPYKKI